MTAGVVLVLGEVGRNFAAGMTGGVAFVLDEFGTFQDRCNKELVTLARVAEDKSLIVHNLVEKHFEMTGSPRAEALLNDWEISRSLFWEVVTQAESAAQSKAQLSHMSAAAFDPSSAPVVADQKMVSNPA
jgi:glutamate synthase domain-containing protein 3